MPPGRRGRLPSWPSSPTVAGRSRGWLSALRRNPNKRPRRAADIAGDDDGTPLSDEILVVIFALLSEIADLVRCAATCRRWRRLVSGEAAFICRTPRRTGGKFVGAMALGFFHHEEDDAAAARFVATASASRRFGLRPPPSLTSLVQGLDVADGLLDSSRVMACRNGLVVVDLRRYKHDRTVKDGVGRNGLVVWNPMTGDAHFLPRLTGKDGVGQNFACTVLTADDTDTASDDPPTRSAASASFRLVMLYRRRDFTAFRSYSSDDGGGGWSEEAEVSGAQLEVDREQRINLSRNSIVARGGRAVYWADNGVEFLGLCLDTLEAATARLPTSRETCGFHYNNTLLGLTPERRLCAVELDPEWGWNMEKRKQGLKINIFTCGIGRDEDDDIHRLHRWPLWEKKDEIRVDDFPLEDVSALQLQWFCEKSGVVFFTASNWSDDRICEAYALNLHTKAFEKLASHVGVGDPWKNLHGYEMDQASYLASLAEPEGMEDT